MSQLRAAASAVDDSVDRATRLNLYRSMTNIRLVEKRAYDLFLQNQIKGTSHLALGQEAIAAGFGVAMRADDYTFCTYRGHAHTLARGAPLAGVLGELMGRECGLMAGKGGSMHLTDAVAWCARLLCNRWRTPADRSGRGMVRAISRYEAGGGLFLRRRHHQYRGFSRGAQFSRRLEAAGRVCLREQPLHGVHADRFSDRSRTSRCGPSLCLRPRVDHCRRE